MGRRAALRGLLALPALASLGARGPALAAPRPFQRGVALGLFSEDALFSYKDLLREIAALGASHVSLVVGYYQRDAASTEIGAHPRFTAPDEALVQALRDARALGLQAMVFPILRLSHPRSDREWRGTLAPRDKDAWWRSYGALLLRLARLCARERAAVLSVGSELSTLDTDRERWRPLVAEVRGAFRGALTYSGNWDHFEDVALYDLVDLAGLCAYFALGKEGQRATADELVAAWGPLRARLERFAARVRRPLLLTEVGYLSQVGAAAWPWRESAHEPVDLEEQRRCYEAFRRAWLGAPALGGAYFWNWYGWGGPTSRGYTPRGKPAEGELRRYFADLKGA